MSDKSLNNLPVVLQTTAIKNFFENTVDQLYSKANTEILKGYIGRQYGNEVNLSGAFITSDNVDKSAYALSPAVNNINPVTGESENIIFYDELCDTLKAYGVNTRNHNALFSSNFNTFLPPINIDKFLNYAEYYWAIPGSIESFETYVFPADGNRAAGLSRSQTYSIEDPATSGLGIGCKISVFVDDSDGSGYVQIINKGNNYDAGDTITITDSEIGNFGGTNLSFTIKEVLGPTALTITPDSQGPLNLNKDVRGKKEFTPVGGKKFRNGMIVKFTGIYVTPASDVDKEFVVSGVGDSIRLTEKNITSTANQDTKDYLVIERGSVTGNDWSSVNHWYHIDNFKEAGDTLPAKKYRANRPIVEFISDLELYYDGVTVQSKTKVNQEPLFNLYDDRGNSLSDEGLYANVNFAGSKIFNYKIGTGTKDPELGFALSFSQTKSASEIAFENFISTERFNYTPFGSMTSIDILGTYYYKITGDTPAYYSSWRASPKKSNQKILTSYKISSNDVIEKQLIFDIGAVPDEKLGSSSGYDILVRHNDTIISNYAYKDSSIQFDTFDFNTGDILEIEVVSKDGLRLLNNSRYDLPLSWANNPENNEVEIVAEPQYLPHFKRLIENQTDFSGNALGRNNFDNSEKDISHAINIVQTDEDLTLGSFLVDDQPHNIIESFRFVGKEYQKFKNRLKKEISSYINRFDVTDLSNEIVLEKVLRNLQSFNIGKDVFGTTYILPYGDTYTEEVFDVSDISDFEYTLSAWQDITKLENTVLVYYIDQDNPDPRLLELDVHYTFSDTNPITVELNSENISLRVGDSIVTKLYNDERDSANCPPTPSAMGLYPLHQPRIETDNTFTTPVDVIVGHDGSKTILEGNRGDALLLEFETRIYNSCQKQFRNASGFDNFNVLNVRPGAFRDTGFELKEFNDLLRNSFTNWANRNKVDALTNEFYDELDKWTWNYRGSTDLPGYWRGWYEYYYDTVRPHTHPWEMLGFFEKPNWWETQYGIDYSSVNIAMWQDIEEGIIRQGDRKTVAQNKTNLFARPELVNKFLPVDKYGYLRAPAEIATTGSTSIDLVWNNRRAHNLVITDQFYDENGSSNLPNGVTATAGSGISFRIAFDADGWDLYSKGFDSFLTSNVYVTNTNIDKSFQFTNYSFDQLGNSQIIFDQSITSNDQTNTPTGNTFIGVSVTGTPITTPKSSTSFNDQQEWHENKYYRKDVEEIGTYVIEPKHAGITSWNTSEHSPIVGWSFDNIPVYGPYGYENPLDSTSSIISIKSSYELKSGTRPSGPGGAYTGEYVEDYTWNSALAGQNGYANKFNMRYGVTPESPIVPIYYYVATYYNNAPQFPFVIGGVKDNASDVTWAGKYYSAVTEPEKNNLGTITETGQIAVLQSVGNLDTTNGSGVNLNSNNWRFGDGAPVENAWKYSSDYPFAVVESLMLSKPGKFATVFADPTNVEAPLYEPYKIINKTDRSIWNYRDADHFKIHGENDEQGNFVTNSGYTQFIHSWLTFQGLNTTTDFAEKLRKVNVKLAHRLEGFSDKDTMILRSDQFSSTGTSQSLVIPEENFKLAVHSSPYKERNFYSGVMVQKVNNGYKVRGYDKNLGYFNTLKLNKFGATSEFEVGGEAVEYVIWEPNVSYSKGTIVSYQNRYYQAENFVTSSQRFINTLWKSLASLPQRGAVKGVVYQETLPEVVRVDYETKFATHQDVLDFLIALGKYQEQQGYDFGGFDTAINDARNWSYAGQQFLFWVAGGWENNNTLELSPMANKISFELSDYFVAKINRIERNQFSLINQDGKVLQPEECEIVRQGNRIEITPPEGEQLYGCLLYTKQTEHALIIDNKTEFNDTIYDQLFNQRQTRLRIKGKKTANWNGTFSSEGFIISGDELKPNLDNMAQSLGRYHELGFIPVEKQLYEKARGLFGYEEKEYLNNLEVDDDTQFEFYSGMIHEKGTNPALSKIAKSNNIVQGEMTVYDEWAVKVGEFGDLENDQAIELKIEKSDLVSSPQMVTLAFPEDTTGVIKNISVIEAHHKYHEKPEVRIAEPSTEPKVQATAEAHLNSDGNISGIQITNVGSGYPTENVKLNIVVSDLLVTDFRSQIKPAIVQSSDLIEITRASSTPELDFLNLTTFKIVEKQTGSDVNVDIDISDGGLTLQDVADYINSNSNVSAEYIESLNTYDGSTYTTSGILSLTGTHFELVEHNNTLANLNLSAGTYEVKQRYSVGSVDNIKGKSTGATTINDINVYIDNTELTRLTNYSYDHGSRTAINFNINSFVIAESQRVDSSGKLFLDTVFTGDIDLTNTIDVNTENLYNVNGVYPYIDLYIDGTKIDNVPSRQVYSVSTNSVTLLDVSLLPKGFIKNGSNVYVHEHSTVELNDNVLIDIPGNDLAIKVSTRDNIIALAEVERIYSITPDSKNDDTILIDIDDSNRFLKKPIGTKEKGIWPTTSNISYSGVTEDKFKEIPNAGYVTKYDVDFRSFSVNDISLLFKNDNFYHPDENHTIHVASAEGDAWNVYKFKSIKDNDANSISYVETGLNTLNLLSDVDLFKYTDTNKILETDTGRFLDYHLVIKDTDQNEKFVVWTNQEQLDFQQVLLSNLREVTPLEVGVNIIKPTEAGMFEIANVAPAVGHWSSAEIFGVGNGVVKVSTPINSGLEPGDQVILHTAFPGAGSGTVAIDGDSNNTIIAQGANTTSWSGNIFTVGSVGPDSFTVKFDTADYSIFARSSYGGKSQTGYLTDTEASVMYFNRTQFTTTQDHGFGAGKLIRLDVPGYEGDYFIRSASSNTLIIDTPFIANAPTSGGNVLTKNLTIVTTDNHGLGSYKGRIALSNHSQYYYNKTYEVRRAFGNIIQVVDTFPVDSHTWYDPEGYSMLSTVDHDMIYPNDHAIKLDNINSANGITESFNRRQAIMRGALTYKGSMGLGFNMLRRSAKNNGRNIIGSTPYVEDFVNIDMSGIVAAGQLKIDKSIVDMKGFVADKTVVARSDMKSGKPAPIRNRKATQVKAVASTMATSMGLPNVFNPATITALADKYNSSGNPGKYSGTVTEDAEQRRGTRGTPRGGRRGTGGRGAGNTSSTNTESTNITSDKILTELSAASSASDMFKALTKTIVCVRKNTDNIKTQPAEQNTGNSTIDDLCSKPRPTTYGFGQIHWDQNCNNNNNDFTFGGSSGTNGGGSTGGGTGGGTTSSGGGNESPGTPVIDPSVLDGLETSCNYEVGTNYPTVPEPPPVTDPQDPEPPVDPEVDCRLTFDKNRVEEGGILKIFIQATGKSNGEKLYLTLEKQSSSLSINDHSPLDSYAIEKDISEIKDLSTGEILRNENDLTGLTGSNGVSVNDMLVVTVQNEKAGPLQIKIKADLQDDDGNSPQDENIVARMYYERMPGGNNTRYDLPSDSRYVGFTLSKILDTSVSPPDAPIDPPSYSITPTPQNVSHGTEFSHDVEIKNVVAAEKYHIAAYNQSGTRVAVWNGSDIGSDTPKDIKNKTTRVVWTSEMWTGDVLPSPGNYTFKLHKHSSTFSRPVAATAVGTVKALGTPVYNIRPQSQTVVLGNGNLSRILTFSSANVSDLSEQYEYFTEFADGTTSAINVLSGTPNEEVREPFAIIDQPAPVGTPVGTQTIKMRRKNTSLHGSAGEILATAVIIVEAAPVEPPPSCTPIQKWQRFYTAQSTNEFNEGNQGDNTDIWIYDLSSKGGQGELVFYNDAGADQIRIYQADNLNSISKNNLVARIANAIKATDEEKNNLSKSASGASWPDFTLTDEGPRGNQFNDAVDPTDRTGARHAGKMQFTVKCPSEGGGSKIIVTVNKTSSVYKFYADIPHISGKSKQELNSNYGNTGPQDPGRRGNPTNPGQTQAAAQTGYYKSVGKYHGGAGGRWYDPYQVQMNFSGFNSYPMTGHRSLPSIFRKPARKSTNVSSNNRYENVTQEKFVTVTQQRISGGTIIPLATPVPRPIRLRPKPIRSTTTDTSVLKDFFSTSYDNTFSNSFDDRAFREGKESINAVPDPLPVRIPDEVWPIGAGEPVQASNAYNGEKILVDEAIFEPPVQLPDSYPGVSVDDPNAPADVDVEYTTQPIITVLPKKEVRPGTLLPDGLVAFVPLYKPTPSVKISADDIIGTNPGDEIIINGTPVTIPGGGYSGFLNSLQCSNVPGVNVSGKVAGTGIPYVKVSSCSNAPLTFRNGCASGGKYKEIMDFHVVRTFQDSVNDAKTSTTIKNAGSNSTSSSTQKVPNVSNPKYDGRETIPNPNYDPNPTIPNPNYDESDPNSPSTINNPAYSDPSNTQTIPNPDYNTAGFINPEGQETLSGFSTVTLKTSTRIPASTSTSTSETVAEDTLTGGSGYKTGDRLRLVGGTPVPTPYGGIYEVCIKNSGANYSSAANVRIYIGNGNSPGSGAKVDYVELDPITKGISKVYMRSAGVGYDIKNPPTVTVVDTFNSGAAGAPKVVPATCTAQVDKSAYHVPRVAKFEVTAVDDRGSIHGIKIIDRGIYEQLPSDLDRGLPLEYDYVLMGDEDDGEWLRNVDADGDGEVREHPTGTGLGQWDPLNNFQRLPSPIGPGGTGYDPNLGHSIGINELSPFNRGVLSTEKVDYNATYPYMTDDEIIYAGYVANKGLIRKNWTQQALSAKDETQISTNGLTYWQMVATIKSSSEFGRWRFEKGKINTVGWTTPLVNPGKARGMGEARNSICSLYISSNGHVQPSSENKYIVVWISDSPGARPIGGADDYRVLDGDNVKGRSNYVKWSHDPRFFDGTELDWAKEVDPGSPAGPNILNGGSTYGLKFLNMCVVDAVAFKGYDPVFGKVDAGDDGFRLVNHPGTSAFIANVQSSNAWWESFSNYNGGLTINMKIPEGYSRIFKDKGRVTPSASGGGLGTITPAGFGSNSNMIPYIGETWDGTTPDHVFFPTSAGTRWGGPGGYEPGIGPANSATPLNSNARQWPVPTNGKVWSYKFEQSLEKFKRNISISRGVSPAGGHVDTALQGIDLMGLYWWSATPGGEPVRDKNGIPQIYPSTTVGAEGGMRTKWVVDLNEPVASGGPIMPIMNKTWFLNDAIVDYATALSIATRIGNTDNGVNARAPTPSELRAWDHKATGIANPWPWMVQVCFGSQITDHESYVNRLPYASSSDPNYTPPEGKWEAQRPVLDASIEWEGSLTKTISQQETPSSEFDNVAMPITYEDKYPLLTEYYVPTNTNVSYKQYGIGTSGSPLHSYPALTSQYTKTASNYADAGYAAAVTIDHKTSLDDIREFTELDPSNRGPNHFGADFTNPIDDTFVITGGTIKSIPFTTPEIITPLGTDLYDATAIGMQFDIGYAPIGLEPNGGLLVWWSDYAGGDPLGEATVIENIESGTYQNVLGTFSQAQYDIRDKVTTLPQFSKGIVGNIGNTYGVKWLNMAYVKETINGVDLTQPNLFGSATLLTYISNEDLNFNDVSTRWKAPMRLISSNKAKGVGTTAPVNYLLRGEPGTPYVRPGTGDRHGEDKLIGGSMFEGPIGSDIYFPVGHINSIPFTTPTVTPKVDIEENFKEAGEGQLNGSGYDPSTGSSGSGYYSYHGRIKLSSNTRLTTAPGQNFTGFSKQWFVFWVSQEAGGGAINDDVYYNAAQRAFYPGVERIISGDPNIFNLTYLRMLEDPNYDGPPVYKSMHEIWHYAGSEYGVKYANFCIVDPELFFTSGWTSSAPELAGSAHHMPGTAEFDASIHQVHGMAAPRLTFANLYPPSYVVKSGSGPLVQGGSGARLYFTSKNIPDCSEKSSAKETLGLPDMEDNADYVTEIADMINDGLVDAGYDPEDISFGADVINDDISILALDAPGYDGVEFGELTPGFLDKLGIPIGDYNHAMACMIMNNQTSSPDENITVDQLNNLTTEEGFVIPEGVALPEEILSITCVTSMEQPGRTIFGNGSPGTEGYDPEYTGGEGSNQGGGTGNDAGGLLGHRGNVTASFIDNLYQYELSSPTGGIIINDQDVQNCDVLYLQSQRFSSLEDLQTQTSVKEIANVSTDISSYDKVWIDATSNINLDLITATGSKTDFVEDGWTFYENGVAKRWAQPLVDPTYIRNVLFYDNDTGRREYDLDLWDPFKGILPAFIDAEIHFVSKEDPVVYNSRRAKFGEDQCGQVWWDTSGVRYNWYEQGSNKERASNWGDVFPGSVINLYEWTESLQPPTQYEGTGTPKNASQYLTDRRKDNVSGEYVNYYYFWVLNKEDLSTHAKMRHMRKFATVDLARYLANPTGQGINTISFLSSNDYTKANQSSMLISNLENIIREDEQILQINLSRNLNPLGLKHVAWKLLRENDVDSVVPEDLSAKLIDSLCQQDATGQKVPADNLSEVEKYGTAFRPRQTMFKDIYEARREMHYALNEILASIKIETLNPKWAQSLPSQDVVLTSNWYEVERTSSTNEKIRYDLTYKALFTVNSVKELDTLTQSKLSDGTIVMVRNSKKDRYQLWRWHGKDAEFKLIAIQNETAQLSDKVFKDNLTLSNKLELREFLYICKDKLFNGTPLWNQFFFSMLKFAYSEQSELDWAFKSSYIYVDKEESDLTKRVGFKPDNFDSVKEYMDEAKPYTSKIREYKDGKKTPIDYISDQMVSDFDIPPYPDPVQGKVRVLNISNSEDTDILTENTDYVKWYGQIQEHSNIANAIVNASPVRTGNIKMVFDRTDWRLLPYNFDANRYSYAQGTAEMISYLTATGNNDVSANSNVSMSGRIFKFNDAVRAQFDLDVTNAGITDVTDKTQLENAYVSGQLVGTLALVKDKVGGGFRGEELDANVFTKVVPGEDPLDLQTGFGFDTDPFDTVGFDSKIEVQNFEGLLNGNTTFRRDGITYEGFDSVTFQKILYGEERPEEMAMFSPLENMIINVRTSVFAYGNGQNEQPTDAIALGPYPVSVGSSVGNNTIVTTTYGSLLEDNNNISLSGGTFDPNNTYTISNVSQNFDGAVYSNTTFSINVSGYTESPTANIIFKRGVDAVDVEYQVHYDMFGGEEWLRKLTDGSTSTVLAKDFEIWDDSFTVDDPTKIQDPKPGVPGTLWINNSERIVYRSLDKAKGIVSDITRGTRGTTIASYTAGVRINTGNYTEIFDDKRNVDFQKRDPDSAYWLRNDSTTLSLTDITNRATGNIEIAKFLQGDDTVSIGWDARGWEVGAWDGG